MTAVRADAATTAERPAETAPAAGGSDSIDRALRLGGAALGRPLALTLGTRPGAPVPGRAVAAEVAVLGDRGERLGALGALDLTSRTFGERDVQNLKDTAALIGETLAARDRIGRVDHVTRLPNRIQFERDFMRLTQAASEPCLVLVTIAEARHFNGVLRALGHANAEGFIRRGSEMVAELRGDRAGLYHVSVLSFAFVIDQADEDAVAIAGRIVALFAEPIMCGVLPIMTRAGVGLAPLKGVVRPAETLRAALAAAQDARAGEHGFAFYNRASDEAHVRSFRLLTDLDEALRDYGQLWLAYQPRVDLRSGRTIGAEALIRWAHPVLGPVPPSDFIPLAEATALIGQITDFVMTRVARQTVAWRNGGLDLKVSLNVSPASLQEASFVDRVRSILAGADADPAAIEFEFTEGVLASSEARTRATVDAIREIGITVAIDDFGTGYSNLDYLTRLPADVVKIDRSLVMPIGDDPRRRKLCRSMIELAQDLEFRVVAEGIETRDVYAMLAGWRCDEGQGYFMSRPLSAGDFEAFAQAH